MGPIERDVKRKLVEEIHSRISTPRHNYLITAYDLSDLNLEDDSSIENYLEKVLYGASNTSDVDVENKMKICLNQAAMATDAAYRITDDSIASTGYKYMAAFVAIGLVAAAVLIPLASLAVAVAVFLGIAVAGIIAGALGSYLENKKQESYDEYLNEYQNYCHSPIHDNVDGIDLELVKAYNKEFLTEVADIGGLIADKRLEQPTEISIDKHNWLRNELKVRLNLVEKYDNRYSFQVPFALLSVGVAAAVIGVIFFPPLVAVLGVAIIGAIASNRIANISNKKCEKLSAIKSKLYNSDDYSDKSKLYNSDDYSESYEDSFSKLLEDDYSESSEDDYSQYVESGPTDKSVKGIKLYILNAYNKNKKFKGQVADFDSLETVVRYDKEVSKWFEKLVKSKQLGIEAIEYEEPPPPATRAAEQSLNNLIRNYRPNSKLPAQEPVDPKSRSVVKPKT